MQRAGTMRPVFVHSSAGSIAAASRARDADFLVWQQQRQHLLLARDSGTPALCYVMFVWALLSRLRLYSSTSVCDLFGASRPRTGCLVCLEIDLRGMP
eukprot:scaffold27875_cov18-Tisochrysis_lutea.AAC.1